MMHIYISIYASFRILFQYISVNCIRQVQAFRKFECTIKFGTKLLVDKFFLRSFF